MLLITACAAAAGTNAEYATVTPPVACSRRRAEVADTLVTTTLEDGNPSVVAIALAKANLALVPNAATVKPARDAEEVTVVSAVEVDSGLGDGGGGPGGIESGGDGGGRGGGEGGGRGGGDGGGNGGGDGGGRGGGKGGGDGGGDGVGNTPELLLHALNVSGSGVALATPFCMLVGTLALPFRNS